VCATLLAIALVVTTHHLTSYALAAFLVLWTLVELCRRTRVPRRRRGTRAAIPLAFTIATLGAALSWLFFVASPVVAYLSRPALSAVHQVISLITGEERNRQLFHSFDGQVNPLWEQTLAYVAVLLVLIGMPIGVIRVWRGYRERVVLLTLAIAALVYPASLALRFTQLGLEISGRSADFVFIALAPLLALAITEVWLARRPGRLGVGIATCLMVLVFGGGQIQGWAHWARLPGAYRVAADTRSIEPQGVEAARWARSVLGADNRIGADRTNALLMASDGAQYPVTLIYDQVNVARIVLSPEWGKDAQATLQRGKIAYLVIDRRLADDLPLVGVYFEPGEPDAFQHTRPVDPAVLERFDAIGNISRIFDSGDIVVYDVRDISSAP
jgi:hypothetical protein